MSEPGTGSTKRDDEIGDLLRGLRLAVIALVSAAATAGLVIGLGGRDREPAANPHYGELTFAADDR